MLAPSGHGGGRRGGRSDGRDDGGSAVAEFVMVTGLLLTLFALVLQVGLVLHVRTVLTASAQEGARLAANADRSLQDGAARTRTAIAEALGAQVSGRMVVTASTTEAVGAPVVQVEVRGAVPLFLLPAGPVDVTVRGRALEE